MAPVRLPQTAPYLRSPTTFMAWAEAIYAAQYTGPTTVHFLHGRPKMIEFALEHRCVLLDSVEQSAQT